MSETGSLTRVPPIPLQVYLLGPPAVNWANQLLAVSRRQVRALLYRLAADRRPVPREHLSYLFWPDSLESTARRNLTVLLSHLGRSLPSPDFLAVSEDLVGLDPERTWSDASAFEQLGLVRDSGAQIEALQQAVDMYRGPFLGGFSLPGSPEFETWVSLERQSWERLYLEALAALLEARAARGEHEAAIACAQRYLAVDDLAEDIHRRLIALHAARGDRSEALRQFDRCVVVLERELGVRPLPETQVVYQSVLEGRRPERAASLTQSAWATRPGWEVPLVGREEALRRLEQAHARAHSGRGGVILIAGEAGIGKTRLMQEFATRLEGQALVLVGESYPAGAQSMPYQPVVEALRPALSAGRALLDVPVTWLTEASRLLPELRSLYPHLPPPASVGPQQAGGRLFEALCQLTLGLATGPRPLVLCLDDLHHADLSSLDWLAYLGRRLPGSRLLVVGSYASPDTDAVEALRRQLLRLGVLTELRLDGLDEAAVLRLVHLMAGPLPATAQPVDEQVLAERLQRASGGNPFFVVETLRALVEVSRSGDGMPGPEWDGLGTELPLPDSVREAVEVRLGQLSAIGRQVLEAGTLLGPAFDFNLVHLTSGRRDMETMDGLDELVARQLLIEQGADYRFQHEIIRAAVYRDLSYWRRRLLHRRAGRALQKMRPEDAASLAWHFERAEEPRLAARYALQAGQVARDAFAHLEARAHFDRALTCLEQEASSLRKPEGIAANQRQRIQALDGRGWALRLMGDMDSYARDSREVARLAEQLGDPGALAHLRWRQAHTHRWFCRYAQASQAAQDGVRLSRAAGDRRLEAMCLREAGMAARAGGNYTSAQSSLEQALSLFVDLGEVAYELHALCNLSTLHWYLGDCQQAMAVARRGLARCEATGLPLERRLLLGDIGAAAVTLGDADLARASLSESLEIACQIADRTQEIFCLGHLGWLEVRLGRPAEALECLRSALALAERIDSRAEQSWLWSGLAEAQRLAGDLDQAEEYARQALTLAQASGRAYEQELASQILTGLSWPSL